MFKINIDKLNKEFIKIQFIDENYNLIIYYDFIEKVLKEDSFFLSNAF